MFLGNYYLKKLIFFTIFLSFVLSIATASELNAESKIEIKASDKLEWDQLENKIIAYGDAVVKSSLFSIIADEIISVYSDALNKDNSLGGVDNEIKALEFLNQALFNYEIFTVNREKMRINITDKEFDRKSILKDSILNKSRIKDEAEKLIK